MALAPQLCLEPYLTHIGWAESAPVRQLICRMKRKNTQCPTIRPVCRVRVYGCEVLVKAIGIQYNLDKVGVGVTDNLEVTPEYTSH